jgi:hypothetical protein
MQKWKSSLLTIFLGLATSILYVSCAESGTDTDRHEAQAPADFYFKSMNFLSFDVVYEPGAEPYTGSAPGGLDYWDILKQNVSALFLNRSVQLRIPNTLTQMRAIPRQNRRVWSAKDAMALAQNYRDSEKSDSEGRLFVAFVRGTAADQDGKPNSNVLGFSVSGATVILIFKDVILSTGILSNGQVPKFVEQSTLVHEVAHTLGLVNNGIPLSTPHQDTAHGKHCANANCVMYYLNEGKSGLASFVQQFIVNGNTIMFGNECLQDSQSY